MKLPVNRYLKLLFTYIRPQIKSVLLLFLLLGVSIGLQLANPQIVRFFIDEAMKGGHLPEALWSGGTIYSPGITSAGN